MAILDNILTQPTYGAYYNLSYRDVHGLIIDVNLYKRDYSGSVNHDWSLLEDGIIIGKSFADGDYFKTIVSTQIELNIIVENNNHHLLARDLAYDNSGDNRLLFLEVKRNLVTVFFGFLLMETCEVSWGALHHQISITASDGLGQLKDVKFLDNDGEIITGMEPLCNIISFIMYKIGLMTNKRWLDAIPIVPSVQYNPGYGCLQNTFIEVDRFGREEKTCYDVLEEILTAFNAQISQHEIYYLIRVPDYFLMDNVIKYNLNGSIAAYAINLEHTYQVGREAGVSLDGLFTGSIVSNLDPPIKSFKLTWKNEIKNIVKGYTWGSEAFPYHVEQLTLIDTEDDHWSYWPRAKSATGVITPIDKYYFPFLSASWVRIELSCEMKVVVPYNYDLSSLELPEGWDAPFLGYMVIFDGSLSSSGVTYQWDLCQESKTSIKKYNEWNTISITKFVEISDPDEVFVEIFQEMIPAYPQEWYNNTRFHIRNMTVKVKQATDEYPTNEFSYETEILPYNLNTQEIEKTYYHYYGLYDFYLFEKVFFTYNGLLYTPATIAWKYSSPTLTGQTINFTTFIRTLYEDYFKNKRTKFTVSLVNMGEASLCIFSKVESNELVLTFIISSFEWNLKMDTYNKVELRYYDILHLLFSGNPVYLRGNPVFHEEDRVVYDNDFYFDEGSDSSS